jgi:hypothetical protein
MALSKMVSLDTTAFGAFNTVDPWNPCVCISKETAIEENPQMLRIHRI